MAESSSPTAGGNGEVSIETKRFTFKYSRKDFFQTNEGDKSRAKPILQATIYRGKFSEIQTQNISKENGGLNGAYSKKKKPLADVPVAIKTYQLQAATDINYERAQENISFLSLPGNKHPNFIRYYANITTDDFIYLVTELCICSVASLVTRKWAEFSVWPENDEFDKKVFSTEDIFSKICKKEILRQSAEAVNYLHGLGLIHRNLHPDNFLITATKNKDGFLVKLTDFQLAKNWIKNVNCSGSYPWSGWRFVPECIVADESNSAASSDVVQTSETDIFILGCYFYYVLTGGHHPFGKEDERMKNIGDQTNNAYKEDWDGGDPWKQENKNTVEALGLIRNMIKFRPLARPSAWKVLDSEYFRDDDQEDYYNIYEDKNREVPGLCVIVSQETFHNPKKDVNGMENNCAQLWRTFRRFGYEVIIYKNLRADLIVRFLNPDELKKKTNKQDLKQYASLVVCILSHGHKGVVLGVDGKTVPIDLLRSRFSSGGCPAFENQPKIFIILACQGNNEQRVYHDENAAGAKEEYHISNEVVQSSFPTKMKPAIADSTSKKSPLEDFISLVSTIENFYSYYTRGVGSPFIEHLCSALMSEYNDENVRSFKDECTKKDLVNVFHSFVVPRVSKRIWAFKKNTEQGFTTRQTPELRSTLTKTIRFRAKVKTHVIAQERNDAGNDTNLSKYDGTIHDASFEHARRYYEEIQK